MKLKYKKLAKKIFLDKKRIRFFGYSTQIISVNIDSYRAYKDFITLFFKIRRQDKKCVLKNFVKS